MTAARALVIFLFIAAGYNTVQLDAAGRNRAAADPQLSFIRAGAVTTHAVTAIPDAISRKLFAQVPRSAGDDTVLVMTTSNSENGLQVGAVLHGFCGGFFGRDSYADKRIEAIGADWVVAREISSGQIVFASFTERDGWPISTLEEYLAPNPADLEL